MVNVQKHGINMGNVKKKKHGYFNGIFPKNIVILWCMSMGKMCYYHRNLSKNMIL